MKIHEPGVLPESNAYFHTASLSAQRLYFTLSSVGRFVCSGEYAVRRASYDSFLVLYVVRGSGYCELNGVCTPLAAGSLALIDCYRMHSYGTNAGWEILWIHFDGRLAREYFDSIAQNRRQIILPRSIVHGARSLEKLYTMFHVDKRVSEALISRYITDLLTEFLLDEPDVPSAAERSARIEEILGYISEHLSENLTLESLARRASLSPFHFSRVFKRETGYTLRDYLVSARMGAARYFLRMTDLPIKEIALRCGYSGDSTFCAAFHRSCGMPPAAYRDQR